jgi:O-antigen biosynthesis protein
LCGLSRLFYYEPGSRRAWEYVYPKARLPWVCGGSFCYRKEFWKKYPFPARNEGADTMWVWGLHGQKIVAHANHSFYVAIIHSKNTSSKRTNDARWHKCSPRVIQDLMLDWNFYANGQT